MLFFIVCVFFYGTCEILRHGTCLVTASSLQKSNVPDPRSKHPRGDDQDSLRIFFEDLPARVCRKSWMALSQYSRVHRTAVALGIPPWRSVGERKAASQCSPRRTPLRKFRKRPAPADSILSATAISLMSSSQTKRAGLIRSATWWQRNTIICLFHASCLSNDYYPSHSEHRTALRYEIITLRSSFPLHTADRIAESIPLLILSHKNISFFRFW